MPTHRPPDTATHIAEALRLALAMADAQALAHLRALPCEPPPMQGWRDIRPALDPREQSTTACDRWAQLLTYAELRHLLRRHRQHAHLVQLNDRST